MTHDEILDSVLFMVRAAVRAAMLSDVDSLSAGIEGSGWGRGVRGGQWSHSSGPDWALFSSDHAPNLGVFLSDDDIDVVSSCGQELAHRLDREEGVERHASHPGWPGLSRDDPRWASWSELEADWVMWDGGPARFSLNVSPARQRGTVTVAPILHFQIERIDTPAEGLPEDDDRDRRVARTGSPLARWHLAGELGLSEDVARTLERDDDVSVVAAVRASEELRRFDAERSRSRPTSS